MIMKLCLYASILLASVSMSLPVFAADDDDAIVAIDRSPADYPKKALRKCIEGNVVLRFVITTEGTTSQIEVVSAKPLGVFEKAAIAAVEKWRFEPRILNGLAVNREATQRLVFEPGCTS